MVSMFIILAKMDGCIRYIKLDMKTLLPSTAIDLSVHMLYLVHLGLKWLKYHQTSKSLCLKPKVLVMMMFLIPTQGE